MIAHLSGIVLRVNARSIVLDVNGVGYEITVPYPLSEFSEHDSLSFIIYSHTTEQGTSLYGFKTWDEKVWFKTFTSVSGIGPKVALSILALASLDDIIAALQKNDAGFFNNISGIGQKTASRIIVELRNSIPTIEDSQMSELSQALVSLGYRKNEIAPFLTKVDKNFSVEKQISQVLAQLQK
ncbi:Holliday junction branch migration protein RuvA [candidate division WWE3 bacterium CG_4_10_14_0_2_um_filter_41_14]|uniref:Holliday junction branch migration complex subunit RuvA n=1 Tax=candidate division WWE3 bacterium CG_4_10_14_0_2_um_filter_41_14 TaxID=1975072 RepID=A0A2M7TL83_UNCKA|nr:MAG: Holliday junction branch migration protein RuvA [candidate division WWE3 bacterium CG_4_10_14_0_2_um_filter_41_14]